MPFIPTIIRSGLTITISISKLFILVIGKSFAACKQLTISSEIRLNYEFKIWTLCKEFENFNQILILRCRFKNQWKIWFESDASLYPITQEITSAQCKITRISLSFDKKFLLNRVIPRISLKRIEGKKFEISTLWSTNFFFGQLWLNLRTQVSQT